jgi:hypothetical protein
MAKRKPLRGAAIFTDVAGSQRQKKRRSKLAQKHASMEAQKPRSIEAQKQASGVVKKVGYYLPPELIEELDEVWLRLRRLNKGRVTRSDIVRAALEEAIAEFREHKSKSTLVARLKGG